MKNFLNTLILLIICIIISGCPGESERYGLLQPAYSNRIQVYNNCDVPVYYSVKNFTKEQYSVEDFAKEQNAADLHKSFNAARNFKIAPQERIYYTWSSGVRDQPLPFFDVDDTFRFIVQKNGDKFREYTKDQILTELFYDDLIVTSVASTKGDYHLNINLCGYNNSIAR